MKKNVLREEERTVEQKNGIGRDTDEKVKSRVLNIRYEAKYRVLVLGGRPITDHHLRQEEAWQRPGSAPQCIAA